MLQGGFGDFYSIATVACSKEAMGSRWQDNEFWEPKAKTFKPLASQSKDAPSSRLNVAPAHRLALLPTLSPKYFEF